MNEDEIAQMFLDECLYNAGIIDKSPFDEGSPKAPAPAEFSMTSASSLGCLRGSFSVQVPLVCRADLSLLKER